MENQRASIQNPQIQILNALLETIFFWTDTTDTFSIQAMEKKCWHSQKSDYVITAIEKA